MLALFLLKIDIFREASIKAGVKVYPKEYSSMPFLLNI
jgi:hypothetical protein